MANYVYVCTGCGTKIVAEHPIGTARRIMRCSCGKPARIKIGEGLYIAAAATPNKRQGVHAANAREQAAQADMPAYKRMRQRGLQPHHIDGCADLENRVSDQDDIDYGPIIAQANKLGGGKARVIEALEATTQGVDKLYKPREVAS